MLVPLLQSEDVVLVMVVGVEVGDVEVAVVEYHEDALSVVELSEEPSVLIVVDAVHVGVEPHLSASQCAMAVALQADAADGALGEEISLGSTSLDKHIGEILLQEDALAFLRQVRLQGHLDDLCLSVGIGGEIDDAAARCSLRDVVYLVAGHGGDVESLDEVFALFSVAVDTVVDGALVVLLEYLYMEDILACKYLVCHFHDLELSILVEDDDIVEVGAVAHEFVLLEPRSHKALLSVDIEFLVRLHHLGHLDGVEVAYLCLSRVRLAVFLLQKFEPVDCDVHHVGEIILYLRQFCFDFQEQFVCLVLVVLEDSLHLDFQQFENIVPHDLTVEGIFHHSLSVHLCGKQFILERLQLGVDESHHLVLALALLELAFLIDALLYKDALQGREEELFLQLALAYHQLLAQQSHSAVHAVAQHVAHGEELRLVVLDDAAVGRDVDFAVAEGIEGIHRLVARCAWGEVYEYLHVGGGHVIHLACLDFSLLHRLGDGVDEAAGGLAEGYLADNECLAVELVNLGSYLEHAATLSVVVFAHVDGTARREVGIDLERLALEIMDGSVAKVVEVVRQHLAAQSYGDALGTLCQE